MTATLIDGAALARSLRAQVAERAAALTARGRPPGLAVILVGNDAASAVYVRNKVKDCEESGIRSVLNAFPSQPRKQTCWPASRHSTLIPPFTAFWCSCRYRLTSTLAG